MQKPPVCKISRLASDISFKNLSSSLFAKSAPLTLSETTTSRKPRQSGTIRLAYNKTSLFAWFDLEETTPLATLKKHDAPLHTENVVELFIDPLGLGKVYYEIQINPLNTSFDAIVINDIGKGPRRGPRTQPLTDWNPRSLRHRSQVGKGRWQVFLSIDFEDLFFADKIPPKKGDFWRANILRIDNNGKETEYCAWSPTGVLDFHNTHAFGKWIFN